MESEIGRVCIKGVGGVLGVKSTAWRGCGGGGGASFHSVIVMLPFFALTASA